jgi:hypothetical protein
MAVRSPCFAAAVTLGQFQMQSVERAVRLLSACRSSSATLLQPSRSRSVSVVRLLTPLTQHLGRDVAAAGDVEVGESGEAAHCSLAPSPLHSTSHSAIRRAAA